MSSTTRSATTAVQLPAKISMPVCESMLWYYDLRTHKHRFAKVCLELQASLEHKHAREPIMLELYSMLTTLQAIGAINSIECRTVDIWGKLKASQAGQRFNSAIPAKDMTIQFNLTWNTHMFGPSVIMIYTSLGVEKIMTPSYFAPSQQERARMRHVNSTTLRTHITMNDLINDLERSWA